MAVLVSFGLVAMSAVPAHATYPSNPGVVSGPSYENNCAVWTFYPGQKLKNGDHINMDIVINGVKKQANAYVDQNIPGGFNGLGLRINTWNGSQVTVPLTEAEVNTGTLTFNYASYLPEDERFVVEWVQMNSTYFNQDRDPSKFFVCGDEPTTPTELPATPDVVDPCGPDNATWVVPEDTKNLSWSLADDGDLIVVSDEEFSDGSFEHNYGQPVDANLPCPPTSVTGVVSLLTDGPTCERQWSDVSVQIPEGIVLTGPSGLVLTSADTNVYSNVDALLASRGVEYAYGTPIVFIVETASGFTYDGAESVSITLVDPLSITCETPPLPPVEVEPVGLQIINEQCFQDGSNNALPGRVLNVDELVSYEHFIDGEFVGTLLPGEAIELVPGSHEFVSTLPDGYVFKEGSDEPLRYVTTELDCVRVGTVGVTLAQSDVCTYDAATDSSFAEGRISFDNSTSNVPVVATLDGVAYQLPAGGTYDVDVVLPPGGKTFTVLVGDVTQTLVSKSFVSCAPLDETDEVIPPNPITPATLAVTGFDGAGPIVLLAGLLAAAGLALLAVQRLRRPTARN